MGLRAKDMSGLLVSVSRGISKADDIAQAASTLRDQINDIRSNLSATAAAAATAATAAASSSGFKEVPLGSYQRKFIELAVRSKVMQFGSFTLKSGRISPYFFNAGLFCTGDSLMTLR